jgi:hypothetical protein
LCIDSNTYMFKIVETVIVVNSRDVTNIVVQLFRNLVGQFNTFRIFLVLRTFPELGQCNDFLDFIEGAHLVHFS